MKDLSNQKKGSLMAFVAVMLITPDSLFIRLSSIDTWGLVFYRGIIPFAVVFIVMMIIYQSRFFKILFSNGYKGIAYIITFSITNKHSVCCFNSKYKCCEYFGHDCNGTNVICNFE